MKNEITITPEFEKELAKSEYLRTRLIIIFLAIGVGISTINYFFLTDDTIRIFGGSTNYLAVVGWLVMFILYEIIMLRMISISQKRGQRISKTFQLVQTLVEVSLPSVLMLYMIDFHDQLLFIDSPLALLYFLFLILSVLHLDFKLSFFTGLLAAVQFAAIVYFAFHTVETEAELDKLLPENSFYIRSLVILISGQAAGFVAEELKKRIHHTFELQQAKNEIEILFGQQVSREVLQTLTAENGKTKKLEATVLALDIRNFSAFAEDKSPDEIMDFQNRIFSPIIKIINQHQGVVNQILGDGIMATFGTPVVNPLHPDMAFEAALQIRKKVFELSENGIIPETRIGIGIHTGDVITGNIGNEIRKQYSISGSAVIIAFRVEQLNKDFQTDILITDAVKNRITPGGIDLIPLGKQTMKGFEYEVELYKVE